MKRLLVTGGCGFIGTNFIRYIISRNLPYFIVNLDKLTYAGRRKNLIEFEQNSNIYKFVCGDILDNRLVRSILVDEKIDIIINFAAETHVDRSISGAFPFILTNVAGTQVLLEEALNKGVELFLQISTDEVYGSILEGRFTETAHLKPSSPYAASKASSDLLALAYYHTYSLPVIITRASNNYGYYQYPEKFIPVMIIRAKYNKSLPIYGDGRNKREWLYVEDHCKALLKILEKGKIGEIYNIGSEEEWENLEVARLILSIMGKSESLIKFIKDRPGHDYRYALNSQKTRNLGWKPQIDFRSGIKLTVEWYCKNWDWVLEILNDHNYQKYFQNHYSEKCI